MSNHAKIIAAALSVNEKQVWATIELLEEGATIPFISRYRKEMTGSLNEVQVATIRDRYQALRELDKRREAILKSLFSLDKLNPELEQAIQGAVTIQILEDIYLPYKPKRKTRASEARRKGLEPLALLLWEQGSLKPETAAAEYLSEAFALHTTADVLAGARDIMAEMVSEHVEARTAMRLYYQQQSVYQSVVVKGKEELGIKYKDYFNWSEAVKTAPSHRVLAMRRGENEGILRLEANPPEAGAIAILQRQFIKGNSAAAKQVELAILDGYKRLLGPAMETELRVLTKQRADEEAIRVFAENARQLLLAAPIGQQNVLAIDPGFRTGCKVVCLDKQGKLLENATIYPHTGAGHQQKAAETVLKLCATYQIESIAIGNGTAGRETESFIKSLQLPGIMIVMVNESGASIYSASEVAREEFPDHDITVRGAVSIGRRLMDPLAELVKIDPKSIGVGQYQHDVDQNKLQQSLDDTVVSCVNAVGVELNTASKQVLAYVSGLGPQLAQHIVSYRNEHGAFSTRESLKKVPRLGGKAYEQAAAFLRIHGAAHPLDASGVHPERYKLVGKMAQDLGKSIDELLKDVKLQQQIDLKRYISDEVGLPTLTDIMSELAKPGRDPREQFEVFSFTDGVHTIADLKIGMKLKGIVTNITNFGAFVDIGVHQDGLVHTSELAAGFVSNPNDIVKVSQQLEVTIKDVDLQRKRISLTMRSERKVAKTTGSTGKPGFKRKPAPGKAPEEEGDLQSKLAALQNKFK